MRRVFLVVALLHASPEWLAAQERLSIPYEQFRLPNGLNVILHEDPTTPTVSVNLWYGVGSGREKPGRTGFAHLFEHILFEGSANVPEGKFDQWLEAVGGVTNGSTNTDRTNYWEDMPSNALELALFLESDRMGHLLPSMSPSKVNGQRDVVKNERRQSYENRPYGMAYLTLVENLFSPDHPYHWPTIGSMDDLAAASYEDVVEFFARYYGPNNASLAIAGDIDLEVTRELVERWFSDVPTREVVPPFAAPPATLSEEKRVVLEDKVQLPRLHICWHTPAFYAPGDAEFDLLSGVLASGKTSRLYRNLVYEKQIAQDVEASQESKQLSSNFCIVATAREGHSLAELEKYIQLELDRLKRDKPGQREVERVINQAESAFLRALERTGGFGGKADLFNQYYQMTGNPGYFNQDLARYRAIDGDDLRAVARTFLKDDARVILSIIPEGRHDLAASGGPGGTEEAQDD